MEEQEKRYAQELRREYAPKSEEEDKLAQLRALDEKVRRPAQITAYLVGIVGALVLGLGMCLAMKVIGDTFAGGIVIGVIGLALVAANYPAYRAILNARRKKYAAKIVALSDELLSDGQ